MSEKQEHDVPLPKDMIDEARARAQRIRADTRWIELLGNNVTDGFLTTNGGGQDEEQAPQPLVKLMGQAQKPIVCGKEVDQLTTPRYLVVDALLRAGPDGLSKPEIEKVNREAVRFLRELSGLPHWKKAISMPGKAWTRYGIVYR